MWIDFYIFILDFDLASHDLDYSLATAATAAALILL